MYWQIPRGKFSETYREEISRGIAERIIRNTHRRISKIFTEEYPERFLWISETVLDSSRWLWTYIIIIIIIIILKEILREIFGRILCRKFLQKFRKNFQIIHLMVPAAWILEQLMGDLLEKSLEEILKRYK